jgi:large subunit ribosomal protein L25
MEPPNIGNTYEVKGDQLKEVLTVMEVTLKADARDEKNTKSEINQLRSKGKVPGVVYGKEIGSAAIAIDQKELLALLREHPHAVIQMELPSGKQQPVMINEVQRDKVNRALLHIDFHQINMDEPVKTTVSLEFIGEAIGVKEGGILQIQHHELEIRCLPNQIPDSIQVNIAELQMGENLLVSDVAFSAGIEVKTDLNEVIVTVLTPQKEPAEEEAVIPEAAPDTNKEPAV